jgi:hypothetical protein
MSPGSCANFGSSILTEQGESRGTDYNGNVRYSPLHSVGPIELKLNIGLATYQSSLFGTHARENFPVGASRPTHMQEKLTHFVCSTLLPRNGILRCQLRERLFLGLANGCFTLRLGCLQGFGRVVVQVTLC